MNCLARGTAIQEANSITQRRMNRLLRRLIFFSVPVLLGWATLFSHARVRGHLCPIATRLDKEFASETVRANRITLHYVRGVMDPPSF
jgi:hypothetical protein